MKKDSKFLSDNNLMDYSLLLCMRNKAVKEKDWKMWGKGKFCCDLKGPGPSNKTPINLNMGIIDIKNIIQVNLLKVYLKQSNIY